MSKFENLVHGISTRDFGSMKNDDGSINRLNLENFLNNLSLPKNGICMGQVHGADVKIVTDGSKLLIENVDGIITNKKKVPLCVMTADCLPILFFDSKNQVIGIAHGGRKGLEKGILQNVLNEFIEKFGSDPKDIFVGIGPGIEKNCYEFDGIRIDIRKQAIDHLLLEGILAKNIENIDICTKDNDHFYSYRGGDISKRFVSVISII